MITVNTASLVYALSFIKDIVPASPHDPLWANVLIQVHEDTLELSGVSYDKQGAVTISATIADGCFDFAVDVSKLTRLVNQLKERNQTIKLRLTKARLYVSGERGENEVYLPLILDFEPIRLNKIASVHDKQVEVAPEHFLEGLRIVGFARGNTVAYSSVHVTCEPGQMVLEAMDGFCGGYTVVPCDSVDSFEIAVPKSIEKPLKKALKLKENTWRVGYQDNKLYVLGADWYIGYSVNSEKYPNISAIYGSAKDEMFQVNREDLMYALSLLTIADTESDKTEITVQDDKMLLTVSGPHGGGKHEITMLSEVDAKVNLVLNMVQLNTILQMVRSDTVNFTTGYRGEAVIVTDDKSNDKYFIIQYN